MSRHRERVQGFRPCSRRETAREHQLLHQLHVRIQWSLCIAGEHVVVHVDGATVVDGIAKSLGHDLHAAVHGQAQLEEARLRCGQGIHTLKYTSQVHVKGFWKKHASDVGKDSIPWNTTQWGSCQGCQCQNVASVMTTVMFMSRVSVSECHIWDDITTVPNGFTWNHVILLDHTTYRARVNTMESYNQHRNHLPCPMSWSETAG